MNQNTALIRKQNRDEIALQKYTMISPLLDENIDPAAVRELRSKLAEQNGLSERTLRRYVNAYQKKGFEGLKPADRVRYLCLFWKCIPIKSAMHPFPCSSIPYPECDSI